MSSIIQPVAKKVLSNGLVVLVRSVRHIPRVSINLWYGVGSKHEKGNEKGLAHLIEHMVFKGTRSKLSEVDIDTVTTKLSGYTNAFTSYDYTAYVFDFSSAAWKQGLILLADTMRNCRFDEQMLNSELSAVIQELKMYKDDYFDTLLSQMCASIFTDHPYHYPVIGFKQDLWNLKRDALVAFYKKQYVPNNAALVVVGDIDPEEVFAEAEAQFGHIPKDPTFAKDEFYLSKDLIRQSVTLYRDVQQPQAAVSYILPGAIEKNRFALEVMAGVLGKAKSSRLYAKLVDELELVSELHCAIDQRQDATILDITFQPNAIEDKEEIIQLIQQEIDTIVKEGVSEKELQRACKQVKVSLLSVLENCSEQAMLIGESFIVTGDENLIFSELVKDETGLAAEIQQILKKYCGSMFRHEGTILPMAEDMAEQWMELQKISDKEDQRILLGRARTTPVEKPRYAVTVSVPPFQKFAFARPEKTVLSNGLTLLSSNNPIVGKIDIVLSLGAKEYADPENKQGLYRFVCDLLLEGTKNYPGGLFAQEVEGLGMTLTIEPGIICITMLKEDLHKGLEFVREIVMYGEFNKKTVEKIRSQILADISMYWDEPQEFCHHLIRKKVYENHPYSKDPHGTVEGIKAITLSDLQTFYKEVFVPQGATIALIGDLEGYAISKEVETVLGQWQGKQRTDIHHYPSLVSLKPELIKHTINRDQVVLAFAARSITRLDPDYEKLLLFDQVFSGGSNGSMTSRLMMIREQSGLFYGIGGTLIAGCDEQPGMVLIKTTVSLDRLEEAQKTLRAVMSDVIDSLTEEEIEQAKRAILEGLVDNFSSSKKIAGAFLGMERFGLPADYFDTLEQKIMAVTLDEVKKAASCVLTPDAMVMFQIGRV